MLKMDHKNQSSLCSLPNLFIDDEEQEKKLGTMYSDLIKQRSQDGFSKRLEKFNYSDNVKYVEPHHVFVETTKPLVLRYELALKVLLEDPNHSVEDEIRLKTGITVLRVQRHAIKVIIRERMFIALLDRTEFELQTANQEIRALQASVRMYKEADARRPREAKKIIPIINTNVNRTGRDTYFRSNQYATSLLNNDDSSSDNAYPASLSRRGTPLSVDEYRNQELNIELVKLDLQGSAAAAALKTQKRDTDLRFRGSSTVFNRDSFSQRPPSSATQAQTMPGRSPRNNQIRQTYDNNTINRPSKLPTPPTLLSSESEVTETSSSTRVILQTLRRIAEEKTEFDSRARASTPLSMSPNHYQRRKAISVHGTTAQVNNESHYLETKNLSSS